MTDEQTVTLIETMQALGEAVAGMRTVLYTLIETVEETNAKVDEILQELGYQAVADASPLRPDRP